MHDHGTRTRHLRPVPDHPATEQPPPVIPAPRSAGAGRVRLSGWQRQETEDARALLMQLLEADAAGLEGPRLAFTLGRLHGAANNLLDIIDAITEP